MKFTGVRSGVRGALEKVKGFTADDSVRQVRLKPGQRFTRCMWGNTVVLKHLTILLDSTLTFQNNPEGLD